MKLAKNQANAKQYPETEVIWQSFTFVIHVISKNNRIYFKKSKVKLVFIYEITRLLVMKMKIKINNRSHTYDINRPRSRDGHKHSKYKKCLNMKMLICIRQHLSNIWSSIHEKVKQHRGWVEKKRCLYKKACNATRSNCRIILICIKKLSLRNYCN